MIKLSYHDRWRLALSLYRAIVRSRRFFLEASFGVHRWTENGVKRLQRNDTATYTITINGGARDSGDPE